jgi:putative peptide zinc metalloprotease protein
MGFRRGGSSPPCSPFGAEPAPHPLRLLPGSELLGPVDGSALQEPPHLVRRPDGQVVQLSRLLYVVAEHARPEVGLADMATQVGAALDLRIRPDQVAYLLEQKLHPLGIVTGADGAAPHLERRNPVFGLRMRAAVIPPPAVNAIGGVLRHLFRAPVVAVALAALLTFDAWLLTTHGIASGLSHVIAHPGLAFALFALTAASLVWHELGHAAACRHGGGRPGAIGVGVYVVWPALYTDATDSYRLGRAGRLRTDLGGMYYVVADLIGVADLFARIGPVLCTMERRGEPIPASPSCAPGRARPSGCGSSRRSRSSPPASRTRSSTHRRSSSRRGPRSCSSSTSSAAPSRTTGSTWRSPARSRACCSCCPPSA